MAIETHDVAPVVRGWLREHVTGSREVADDEQLIDEGVLTSLQTVELVLYLESQFGIDVPEDDFVEENFQSVDAIARYVVSKRG